MEVVVDPLDGSGLFAACEAALRDLQTVFRSVSGWRILGKRIPFTHSSGGLHRIGTDPPIIIFQGNGYPSGISGDSQSWWFEINSRKNLGNVGPASVTIIASVALAILVGEDTMQRVIFGSVSPVTLIFYTLVSAYFYSRGPVRWITP